MMATDPIYARIDRFVSEVYESFNKDQSEIDTWIS